MESVVKQAQDVEKIEVTINYRDGRKDAFEMHMDDQKPEKPEFETEEEFQEYLKGLQSKKKDLMEHIHDAVFDALEIRNASTVRQIPGTDIFCLKPGHHYIGNGIQLIFQTGPVKEVGKNGANHEDIMQILIDRLQYFQKEHEGGKFACRENAISITKQEESLMWQEKRMNDRRLRGVEGKNIV